MMMRARINRRFKIKFLGRGVSSGDSGFAHKNLGTLRIEPFLMGEFLMVPEF